MGCCENQQPIFISVHHKKKLPEFPADKIIIIIFVRSWIKQSTQTRMLYDRLLVEEFIHPLKIRVLIRIEIFRVARTGIHNIGL